MMNTKKSKLTDIKKVVSIPVLIIAFVLFVQKTYANPIEKIIKETQEKISKPEKKSVSEAIEVSQESERLASIEEPLKMTIEEKKVSDTIRPQGGKNTNQETTQNTTRETLTKDDVTLLPQYPGGITELRTNISKLFDGSKINLSKTKEMYKSDLSYTITENGSVTDIKAAGNNELFNNETIMSFKKANENITWKPAEKDGKAVRYRMRIPLTMSFQ